MSADLLRTPLYELHVELGAKMVPFAGYEMPVNYPGGIIAEHRHCRESAALFDVSHMGQLRLVGDDAAAALETLVPVDVVDLAVGKQRYALFTNPSGGILDDLMIARRERDLFVVVNAACKAADTKHLLTHIGHRCQVVPLPDRALLALQGQHAVHALQRLAPGVEQLVFMTGGTFAIGGVDCFITRSGYTGEDGFEISVPADSAVALAKALLSQPEVKPAGLGARDTLRLEAGLCLYGHDINEHTTPIEAGLTWAIQKVRRARRPLSGRRQDRGPAGQRRAGQARRPARPRAHPGARGRDPGRRPGPQAGPRDQRHARAHGQPADRDGLPGRQSCDRQPRGLRGGARQAPADARGRPALRPPRLPPRLTQEESLPMTTMFTPDHEWINIEDHEAAVVGITLHAQDALGDVVFVDLPQVGKTYKRGEVAGVVESVKAAADLYMPVEGEVVEVNEALRADPSLANKDPMGEGWFFKVHVTHMEQFDELMDPPAYDKLLKSL
jgi:aminomethyltransferase